MAIPYFHIAKKLAENFPVAPVTTTVVAVGLTAYCIYDACRK